MKQMSITWSFNTTNSSCSSSSSRSSRSSRRGAIPFLFQRCIQHLFVVWLCDIYIHLNWIRNSNRKEEMERQMERREDEGRERSERGRKERRVRRRIHSFIPEAKAVCRYSSRALPDSPMITIGGMSFCYVCQFQKWWTSPLSSLVSPSLLIPLSRTSWWVPWPPNHP